MGLHIFFKKQNRGNISNFIPEFINLLNVSLESEVQEIKDDYEYESKIKIKNNSGYFRINNISDREIFGDVEVDVFPNKINPNEINNFFDLILNNVVVKESLDDLFFSFKQYLWKAYVDIDGDGDENPLDVLYEYDFTGSNLFIKLVRVLESLSEENEEFEELYERVRESNRSYLSSVLWNSDNVRAKALSLAIDSNVVAQEGSIKLYAKDKESMKRYYEEMINNILKPLFNQEPLSERAKRI